MNRKPRRLLVPTRADLLIIGAGLVVIRLEEVVEVDSHGDGCSSMPSLMVSTATHKALVKPDILFTGSRGVRYVDEDLMKWNGIDGIYIPIRLSHVSSSMVRLVFVSFLNSS